MAGAVVAAPTNTGPSDPTAFGEAATNIDQAKAAALAALAAGGTAGLQAHLAAQAALGSDRQNAIQATLAAAGAAGAPPGAAQELQATLNTPYDQYAATNAALQAAGQQADAQRTAAAGTYFNEASAALPIVRAQAEGRLALARQAAAQNAQARQAAAAVAAQRDAISLQLAQLDLAKAQAGGTAGAGGGADTPAKIIAALGGPAMAGSVLQQNADNYTNAHIGDTSGATLTGPNGTFSARTGGVHGVTGPQALDNSYGGVGLPGVYEGPLSQATANAQANQTGVAQSRQDAINRYTAENGANADYKAGLPRALAALAGDGAPKQTPAQEVQALIQAGMDPKTADQVVRDAAAILNSTVP